MRKVEKDINFKKPEEIKQAQNVKEQRDDKAAKRTTGLGLNQEHSQHCSLTYI